MKQNNYKPQIPDVMEAIFGDCEKKSVNKILL